MCSFGNISLYKSGHVPWPYSKVAESDQFWQDSQATLKRGVRRRDVWTCKLSFDPQIFPKNSECSISISKSRGTIVCNFLCTNTEYVVVAGKYFSDLTTTVQRGCQSVCKNAFLPRYYTREWGH